MEESPQFQFERPEQPIEPPVQPQIAPRPQSSADEMLKALVVGSLLSGLPLEL